MSERDGLTAYSTYTARTETFAAGSQVRSATLNAIQDGLKDLSNNVDEAIGRLSHNRTATVHHTDDPAPDVYGGRTVWIHKVSEVSTATVVLDTSMDWRDRLVDVRLKFLDHSTGAEWETSDIGEADDDNLRSEWGDDGSDDGFQGFFYAQAGQDGAATIPGISPVIAPAGDQLRFFARASDGALCMKRNGTTTPDPYLVVGIFTASPMWNAH